ncbi:hypothetical protein EH223_13360 [candidate division KSB1 bacterium]|nr:hypothetical protein [candidate division KSB1 bacterium]RQW02036.1 MAG: hypothetical protein EH223_13360 [candidate division KSB1 bacterium]
MAKYKYHRFLLVWAALMSSTIAQETIELSHLFDDDMTKWYEISFRCSELVPYFYQKNEQDSLSYVLQYWEQETGVMEPIRRAWRLNRMAQNSFDSDDMGDVVVDDMIDYLKQLDVQKSDTSHWQISGGGKGERPAFISTAFNQFTQSLANELLSYTDLSDDEYLLCLFYSHQFDEFWRLLNSGEARYTTLYRVVQGYKKDIEKTDMHYGFFLGYWTPRRDFVLFGDKVNLGGTFGLQWQRLYCDVSMLLQFLDSQNPYTVKHEGEFFETTHYFRIYLGVEPAFKLYDWGRTRINLLAGAGVDILEAVSSENNPDIDESISVAGPHANLGVGLQYYLVKGQPYCLSCQLRYEYASYETHGGTDFSRGEGVSFRLGVMWDANARKHEFKKYFD